jgi:hypothetical protein
MIDAIKGNRCMYTNKKRLTNKMEIFWKKKKTKLRNLDWFTEENIDVQEKTKETKEWLTGIKKTLHLGGYDKDKRCARKDVEQIFPKQKHSRASGSRLMRTNIVIDNLFSCCNAKSYIESTNIVKFC